MFDNLIILRNLPALIVALPILFAAITAIIPVRIRSLCWLLSYAVCGLIFLWSGFLFLQVMQEGSVNYYMGNWPPPLGVEYTATKLNIFMLVLVSGIAFLTIATASRVIEAEVPAQQIPVFYACFLLLVSGLMGMVISNDIFNIYVFLEISSIASYGLVATGKNKSSLPAAFNYMVIGTIGGVFFLLGIGLLYSQTGMLNLDDILRNLGAPNKVIIASMVFMLMGLMIKSALFPLGFWLPNVYATAPSAVTTFLSSVAGKVSIYLVIRISYQLFGNLTQLDEVISIFAIAAIIFGSIAACCQNDLRRIFAYSSIANIGYIFLAIFSRNQPALIAAFALILTHALAKGGLFVFAGSALRITDLAGLSKKYPFSSLGIVILMASLIGIPLLGGFIAKWHLLEGLLHGASLIDYCAIIAVAIGTICAVIYMWRIIEVMYFHDTSAVNNLVISSRFSIILLAVITLFIGTYPLPFVNYFSTIAQELIHD